MPGGLKVNATPRSVLYTSAGDVWSVTQTPLEVQEMQELAYSHNAPYALLEFTMAFYPQEDAPYHGKVIMVRADHISSVAPPALFEEDS